MCNEGLLVLDACQKLSPNAHAAMTESERTGIVRKTKAAKGEAPGRTRLIKISNAVDNFIRGTQTKYISDFIRPIQGVPTVFDGVNIARMDFAVVCGKGVDPETVNQRILDQPDPDLEVLREARKWVWSKYADYHFTDEAIDYLLEQATKLTKKFYSESVPLTDINLKWKLARMSMALANLTLSTTPDFKLVKVTKAHVEEVVKRLKSEYIKSGLNAQAKSEEFDKLDIEDAAEILTELWDLFDYDLDETIRVIRWIADTGGFTSDELKEKFNLADNNQWRPLKARMQNLDLIARGRGFVTDRNIIQLYKLLENREKEQRIRNLCVNYRPPETENDTEESGKENQQQKFW